MEFADALERIEIFLRTIIAHEIGRINPLAYLDKKQFSKSAFDEFATIKYDDWLVRHNKLIRESKEDSIEDHRNRDKPIPIWVAAEAWDFGALSKFYTILSGKNKDLICNRLGLDNRKELNNWLINLNGVRNRCAHHSRFCNRPNPRALVIPQKGYFNLLDLTQNQARKFYGMTAVIWFLLKKIGPNSEWINRIADLVDQKPNVPGFTFKSMGFPEEGFPRKLFPETIQKPVVIAAVTVKPSAIDELEARVESLLSTQDEVETLASSDNERLREAIDKITAFTYTLDDHATKD
jgi:abortive infection bacteriophage resistance protein